MWMGFSTSYFLRPAHVLMSTPADGQDRRGVPGHLEDCMEPSMDAAQRVPSHHGIAQRPSCRQPSELRCSRRAAEEAYHSACKVLRD
eukprot:scaffold148150_cov21-Tisochrysis_lutea.AAC.1